MLLGSQLNIAEGPGVFAGVFLFVGWYDESIPKDVNMEFFLYGMAILGVVVVFCGLVLAALMLLTIVFLNDPEFKYEDDLEDEHTWNHS